MDRRQRNTLSIAMVAVLVAIAWWQFWPPGSRIRQGLDIRGGVSVILSAEPRRGETVTEDDMERVQTILDTRVNALGASEASVQRQGGDTILVQLPGIEDQQAALDALGSTGRLEFIDVASLPTTIATAIQTGEAMQDDRPPADVPEGVVEEPVLTGEAIRQARPGVDENGAPAVNVTMTNEGTEVWSQYTTANQGKQVAIVLDGEVISAPQIREPITSGDTQISGGQMTADEAKRLAAILQAGALPVELVEQSTQVVGPTLGQEALQQGLWAGLAGMALVALYMLVFYRGFGVLSWFSLIVFGSLFLGILAGMSKVGLFTLTLPGIAGVILTVGVAADSAILMFERFKEEVRAGKTARSAAVAGTRHAYGTNVDGDLVTVVTALVLYALAIGPVKGFAVTLMIGTAIDLFVAWFFTRPAIILGAEWASNKVPWLVGLKGGGAGA